MKSTHDLFEEIEYLDDAGENLMIVRVRWDVTGKIVQKFAVLFIHHFSTRKQLIFMADGSQAERVHVHYFFKKPAGKEYQEKPLTEETIIDYMYQIKQNWQWYLANYRENY